MNKRGQFSIIAALLVAVVLVTTAIVTYSIVRDSPTQNQPTILSAIEETNLAMKHVLGFTVGYYGSALQVTGNSSYAKTLATNYLQSGLKNVANTHPEWGMSLRIDDSALQAHWFTNESYSSGSLTVSYDLAGLGITGINYQTSCKLSVQVVSSIDGQAYLNVTEDENEPLITLGKQNFHFYLYSNPNSTWEFAYPTKAPTVYANGTYNIDIPSGINPYSYTVQVGDQRGIIVVASSFNSYTCALSWNSTSVQIGSTATRYVDSNTSDVDSSPSKGAHSNFTTQMYADNIQDELTENWTNVTTPEEYSYCINSNGAWTDSAYAYDNNTATAARYTWSSQGYSAYLVLNLTHPTSGSKIRYLVRRSGTSVTTMQIDIANQTGSWTNVFNAIPTYGSFANASFTKSQYSAIRFRFYKSGTTSRSAFINETQAVDDSATAMNCQLDLEEQWTNIAYTNAKLCIKTASFSGAEVIKVDAWNGSAWINILGSLIADSWNNITVSAYLNPPDFTIRFKGTDETSDPVQDAWQIDSVLLSTGPSADLYSLSPEGTILIELLQNGTMRWTGQNLILTNSASTIPFPPVPVRSIHVNQTINGIDSEVPFQIEDWSSAYRIPLGLTSNASIFSSRTMLVFLATQNVLQTTIWWNGSDMATQTPYAYVNRYFNDSPSLGRLSNGIMTLQLQSNFVVNSTVGTSSSTANFMRINNYASSYGSEVAYVITNGTVRDIIHQEPEWRDGVPNCADIYSDVVLTLPANTTYYTYQLRIMFVQSQQNRTIADMCPIWLTSLTGQLQTENGTASGLPIVSNATDLFYNYSTSSWAHHWSQSILGTKGAGILSTDTANQNLYIFDSITSTKTGALLANSTTRTIQLLPIAKSQLAFNTTLDPRMQDIIWYGAVATFDATTPIYNNSDQTGLWIFVEYPPTIAITTENYK